MVLEVLIELHEAQDGQQEALDAPQGQLGVDLLELEVGQNADQMAEAAELNELALPQRPGDGHLTLIALGWGRLIEALNDLERVEELVRRLRIQKVVPVVFRSLELSQIIL